MQGEILGNYAAVAGKKLWEPHQRGNRQGRIEVDLGTETAPGLWENIKGRSKGPGWTSAEVGKSRKERSIGEDGEILELCYISNVA